jgi:hypothetical protein
MKFCSKRIQGVQQVQFHRKHQYSLLKVEQHILGDKSERYTVEEKEEIVTSKHFFFPLGSTQITYVPYPQH